MSSTSSMKVKTRTKMLSDAPDKKEEDITVYVFTYRQDDLTWRRIVFLPFNFYWRMFIAIAGVIFFNLLIYEEVFLMADETYYAIKRVINIFYFVDLVLTIIHKVWESVRKSMPYRAKSSFLIMVDILSILPLQWMSSEPILSPEGELNWIKLCSLISCLRVYRIYVELFHLQSHIGVNPVFICIVQQNALMFCLSAVLCSFWYALGYVYQNDELGSWLQNLKNENINLNMDNPLVAYVISFLIVYAQLNGQNSLKFSIVNYSEIVFLTVVVYIGFLLLNCYCFSTMMASYLKYQKHMYTITDHIKINKMMYNEARYNILDEYYQTFWTNWLGLHKCPLFDVFPMCLQKDILTDEFWDAIDHSLLMRAFPINIKRSISLVMKSSFMQPGEYIYKKGKLRDTYYYISSGVVQIMSHYDGKSPIMTIAAGSCLGSMSLVLPSLSPTDVICATECEVRFLRMVNFSRILRKHANSTLVCQNSRNEVMSHAKMVFNLSKVYRNYNAVMLLYGVPQDDKLKWIKHRWRTFSNIYLDISPNLLKPSSVRKIEEMYLPIDMTHTSKYLDLIVLSSESTYDANKCCTKSTCSYVMEPDCNFLEVWLKFLVFFVTIDAITVPYCAAFLSYTPDGMIKWDQLLFFVYLFDIYVQVITAVRSVDRTITKPTALLRYHFKDLIFILDLFASLPFREVARLLSQSSTRRDSVEYLGLFRLLKLIRVFIFFKKQSALITAKLTVTLVTKYMYTFFIVMHITACIGFIMVCSFEEDELICMDNSWFYDIINLLEMTAQELEGTKVYVVDSYVFVIELLTNCGFDILEVEIIRDVLYSTLIVFISKNLSMCIFSELMAMWSMKRRRKIACTELMTSLQDNFDQKGLHPGLKNMIISYILLQWKVNNAVYQNIDSIPASEIISPPIISQDRKLISDTLRAIPYFASLDENMFSRICRKFKIYTIPKGYIFCRSGESSSSCNVLLKGFCNMTSMLKEDVIQYPNGKRIGPGFYFPLLEVLRNIPALQTTVSVTECSVLAINADLLRSIIYADVETRFLIKLAGHEGQFELDVVLSKKKYKKVNESEPNIFPRLKNKKPKKLTDNKNETLITKKLLAWFNIIWNPNFIINPCGPFIHKWETIKFIQVLCTIFYTPIMILFICETHGYKHIFAFIFDIISIIDVYIRFNLGYYNDAGIVISNKRHYCTHSFFIDFISSLPFYYILRNSEFNVLFILTMFTKLLQVYRIIGYMSVLKRKLNLSDIFALMIIFFISTTMIMCVTSSFLYYYNCNIYCDEGSYRIDCNTKRWMETNILFEGLITSPLSAMLSSLYVSVSFMVTTQVKAFRPNAFFELEAVCVITIIAYIVKMYFLPKAVAYLLGGNLNYTKHWENLDKFNKFILNEGGDKQIAVKIVEHFVYNYRRSRGVDMNKFSSSLHPSILYDLTFAMYYNGTSCLHHFVGESRYFIKMLSADLREVYFRKDSLILDFNQINNKIYFVNEGEISAIDNEDNVVRNLKQGSMFGSFKLLGKTRHKFKFTCDINSCLLVIESFDFIKIFHQYNKIQAANFLTLTKEKEFVSNTMLHSNSSVIINPNGMDYEISTTVTGNSIFCRGTTYYEVVAYVLSLLVPYLTLFPLLFTAVFRHETSIIFNTTLYTLDIISCFRIFWAMNTTYIDKVTGVYVNNLRKIRMQYITRPSGLLLDILSLFPFEIFGYLITGEWLCILRLNRMLRLIYMATYLFTHKATASVNIFSRWFTFAALVVILPFALSIMWVVLIYNNGKYVTDHTGTRTITDPYEMFILALNEIVVIITFSSYNKFLRPWNNTQCVVVIFVTLFMYMCFPVIVALFTEKMETYNFSKKKYEYKIYCMKLYLQLRDLSSSLLIQLWDYSQLLWASSHGEFLPKFVNRAPSHMKSLLLYDLYGGHLLYNLLFDECNRDFVFQLAGRFCRTVYFPGNFIVRRLDVDRRMYFINSGEVEAIEFDELNKEIVKDVFITGQCFGLEQGLFDCQPHLMTYKARSMVELLTLEQSDIRDLLDYFPEDAAKIYGMAKKLNLLEVD